MKPVCHICRTTKFRRSADSGLVCKYGHKVLGVQQEEAENDYVAGGGTKRKRVRKLKESHSLNPVQQRSYELQIMQFALQVLARSMIQEFKFPSEFETTLRELWLLYVSDSNAELAEAYLFVAREKEKQQKTYEKESMDPLHLDADGLVDDLELMELFKDSENEDDETPSQHTATPSRLKWPTTSYPDILAFVYLTCVYLRYPVLPNDILMWCKTAQLPYLHIQNRVPEEMIGTMPLFITEKMSRVPALRSLNYKSVAIARCFYVNCKLEMPKFNIPVYLDRFCSYYFLPVEGYFYASYLFEEYIKNRKSIHLSISFQSFTKASVSSLLLACVIATAKLLYSIDGSEKDMQKASQYNKFVSKESWLTKVHVNYKLWQARIDNTKKLDFVLDRLKEKSRTSHITAGPQDRHAAILNVLSQSGIEATEDRPHALGIFMKPPKVLSMNVDFQNRPLLKEGAFYYMRRQGFRPKDYCSLLKFAALIEGDLANVEKAMRKIDKSVLKSFSTLPIRKSEYKERYGLKKKTRI